MLYATVSPYDFIFMLLVKTEKIYQLPSSSDCQPGWFAFNGKCYKYFSEKKTWEDAEDQCVEEQVGR